LIGIEIIHKMASLMASKIFLNDMQVEVNDMPATSTLSANYKLTRKVFIKNVCKFSWRYGIMELLFLEIDGGL